MLGGRFALILLEVGCGHLVLKDQEMIVRGCCVISWKGISYCAKVLVFVDLVLSREVNKLQPQTKLGSSHITHFFLCTACAQVQLFFSLMNILIWLLEKDYSINCKLV